MPTEEELEEAIFKMKKGKAAGKSGILPELLLYGGGALWLRLLELIQDMWNQGRVVSDWKDALIVPIPKKGDLQQCDNWRGIVSLLDVAGKVFARVIQERLSLKQSVCCLSNSIGQDRKEEDRVQLEMTVLSLATSSRLIPLSIITLLQITLFRNWYYQRIFPIRNHSSLIPHILD